MKRGILASVAVSIFCVVGLAKADSLYLVPHPPDISSFDIEVNYDSFDKYLTAFGYSYTFDLDGTVPLDYDIFEAPNWYGGPCSIVANIDNQGHPIIDSNGISGMLTINGYLSWHGTGPLTGTGTLLTGTLSQFGFPIADAQGYIGDTLEFVFTTTGGDLAGYYGQANVILSYSGFKGTFGQDFHSGDMGAMSDTFAPAPVPAPTAVLLGIGGLSLVCLLKRRIAKSA